STQPIIVDHVEETSQDDLSTSGNSIRRRYLEFYQKKGHTILRSSSLVPDNEDTDVLLTIVGMLQFKPIFLGKIISSLLGLVQDLHHSPSIGPAK
ncbi:alanine--tRNA ligase, chloroplastic/mitochondrial isoform X1, partial [Tanacetum coccineum]